MQQNFQSLADFCSVEKAAITGVTFNEGPQRLRLPQTVQKQICVHQEGYEACIVAVVVLMLFCEA